jgi:hypothetical protein
MHRDICFEIEAYAKGDHRDHQAVFDVWREEYPLPSSGILDCSTHLQRKETIGS